MDRIIPNSPHFSVFFKKTKDSQKVRQTSWPSSLKGLHSTGCNLSTHTESGSRLYGQYPRKGLFDLLVSVSGSLTKLHLYLHETVVFGDTVCTAERTGLDLAAVGCDCDIGDGRVLSLAGAV